MLPCRRKLKTGGIPITKTNKIRINDEIQAEEVRLINEKGEQVGIIPLEEAVLAAEEAGLDLVEVAPNGKPPVCRLLNYGKLKYEEKKKAQLSKKKQHVIKIKEVRFRPRIDDHDLNTKINQGRKFLSEGYKLKVTLMYRGRELARQDLGKMVLNRVVEMLSDLAEVEKQNELEGRRESLILSAK